MNDIAARAIYYGLSQQMGRDKVNLMLAGMFLYDSSPELCKGLMSGLPEEMTLQLRQKCDQQATYLREAMAGFEKELEDLLADEES